MSFELKVALWICEEKSSDESIHSERQGPISVQALQVILPVKMIKLFIAFKDTNLSQPKSFLQVLILLL